MSNRKIQRRSWWAITLVLLVLFLVILPSGPKSTGVQATVCCSFCDDNLNNCEDMCFEAFLMGGNWDAFNACLRNCARIHSNCHEGCDPDC